MLPEDARMRWDISNGECFYLHNIQCDGMNQAEHCTSMTVPASHHNYLGDSTMCTKSCWPEQELVLVNINQSGFGNLQGQYSLLLNICL